MDQSDRRMQIKEHLKEARRDVQKRMFSYIGAGLGLVIGLAWNEAIKALIDSLFPDKTTTIAAKFVYAIIITIFIGLAMFYAEKLLSKDNES